ncbi:MULTISPECIES: extracellular solute-binding protein [Halomonadaceae]|jgi:putative spermidine/putrescine transport system substrate-binding protein|uniref:extracellular solute-binding protein n=1 Tax=Halomonadaceae TaxID=28256 RepID=UPI0012F3A0C7|nr:MULTISPECIES: extracellular solute-binding protein [Halomonas]CAD5268766.1 Iron ABC transporter substrate-binding protein [Halomonas sp. I3]CAD5274696.1 Iron ABC transporter substrate-binding protein [Halomonas sp. 113]CAD5276300.1 Iron ABC transporter substrate-binding protein [Halomonas sp. 59]CAD5277300.1 Iron ABC transporter substrate-binding protein [Halomonas sp. 156]VXB97303.1 Iron ABC transporter substrate-binding protein [Halomonas titanicae]
MKRSFAYGLLSALSLLPLSAYAANTLDSEFYDGEQELYEAAQEEGLVVSFDTGPTWANWQSQFNRFTERYPGVQIVFNDLGSGATVVALEQARNRPQADTAYYYASSAINAHEKELLSPFTPINFDSIPDVFKADAGEWFTIHSLNVAFIVNTQLVDEVPQSWEDLLDEQYRNSIVYLDPRSTGQGQVLTLAANYAMGGDLDNLSPGIDYLAELSRIGNVARVVGTTPYAQFVRGEIPIWIGYENDGLKASITDGMGDNAAVVIPEEASVAAPYAISLVKNGPNPNAGRLWLNYVMSDEGQRTFAEGFVRPVNGDIELPDTLVEAPQIRPLDVQKASSISADLSHQWTQHVLNQ